ncbi:Rrf2 family transcriptional regulator [Dellaglioa sp. BT-FLS60]
MKYSVQFSDAIHILAYIEISKDTNFLSSQNIANSVETNPSNVRKIMSHLKKSELIMTTNGQAKATLAKSPKEISLLDIYRSIEGNTRLIQVDPKTNPACFVGGNIQDVLSEQYALLQDKVEQEMAKITLDKIIHHIATLETDRRPENAGIMAPFI